MKKVLVAEDEESIREFIVINLTRSGYTVEQAENGSNIELTQVEFQIIEYFFKNPNAALTRTDILKTVWGNNYFGDDKIVDVNIRRLRMKVEDDPSNPVYLTTIWGLGYKWVTKNN